MKKLSLILLALIMLVSLISCDSAKVPVNGEIKFHEISLIIPSEFIGDTSQSNEDKWVFTSPEHEIVLTRTDRIAPINHMIRDYCKLMEERNVSATEMKLGRLYTARAIYMQDGISCKEIFLVYRESAYTITLKGVATTEFDDLVNTIEPIIPLGEKIGDAISDIILNPIGVRLTMLIIPMIIQILLCMAKLKKIVKSIPAIINGVLLLLLMIACPPQVLLSSNDLGMVFPYIGYMLLLYGLLGMFLGYLGVSTVRFLKKSVDSMKKAAKEKKELDAEKERERY